MKSAIINTYNFNRGFLDILLKGIPAEKFTHQPVGITNHALWQVGHLASSSDTALKLLGGQPVVSDKWRELFGNSSKPVDDPSIYPSMDEAIKTLDGIRPKLIAAFEAASDELLNSDPPIQRVKDRFGTTVNFIVFLMTSHELFHAGQLSSWRRAIGLGSAM